MRPGLTLRGRRQVRRRKSRSVDGPRMGGVARACVSGLTYPFTVKSELGHFAGDSRRPLQFGRRDADAIEAELYSHLTPVKRRLWAQRALLLIVRGLVLLAAIQLVVAV